MTLFGNRTVRQDDVWLRSLLKRPSDFGYNGNPEMFISWSLGPVILTRDSDILTESNYHAIVKRLESFPEYEDLWAIEECSHWAVGWVKHLTFQVFDDTGNVSPIVAVLIDIHNELCDYPLLDEDDFSEREYDAAIENIKDACRYWQYDDLSNDDLNLPENYEYALYSWFSDNNYGAIENKDGRGGWPNDTDLYPAFFALGYLAEENEEDDPM